MQMNLGHITSMFQIVCKSGGCWLGFALKTSFRMALMQLLIKLNWQPLPTDQYGCTVQG